MSRLLLVLFLLIGCAAKAPVPPPEYADPERAPTGDPRLESQIAEAQRLARLTDEDLAELGERAGDKYAEDKIISDFVGALIGRGENGKALQFLHDRALNSSGDGGKMADALGFAMGQLRWATCERMAYDYLTLRHSSGVFLVRALCLERTGNHAGAIDNVLAAANTELIDKDYLKLSLELLERRSSSGMMQAGDERVFDKLMFVAKQMGVLDRLFVHHLMGIWPEIPIGTVEPGGLSSEAVRFVVESRARAYRYCFELANADLRGNKRLAGRLVMEFKVGSGGEVLEPRPVLEEWRGHEQGAQVATCIGDQMLRLRFPRPRYGLPQVAQHEFSFRPN